jgi:hypothetical protein
VGAALAELEAVGKNAQCQDLGLGHGFVGGRSIGKDAGQLRNLRNPTAVFFVLALRLSEGLGLAAEGSLVFFSLKAPGMPIKRDVRKD